MKTASFRLNIDGINTSINSSQDLADILKQVKKTSGDIKFDNASLAQYQKLQAQLTHQQQNRRKIVKDLVTSRS
jgi:hypothetical protein